MNIKKGIKNFLQSFSREKKLIAFFGFLFLIIILRLFYLQVLKADHYKDLAREQHMKKSSLQAQRGNIYLTDKSNNKVQLTENIPLYSLYVDPKLIPDKGKLIELIVPVVYRHLCDIHRLNEDVSDKQCIKNIQEYTSRQILLKESEKYNFYLSGKQTELDLDREKKFKKRQQKIIDNFDKQDGYDYISDILEKKIKTGYRKFNYLGFFEGEKLLSELKEKSFDFIAIKANNYVYIDPSQVDSKKNVSQKIQDFFAKFGYAYTLDELDSLLEKKQIRYVNILEGLNPKLYRQVQKLKENYYGNKKNGIPILHGLGIEKENVRYYPYNSFLSHVLGYVDKNGDSFYGIEEYYNDLLDGQDGMVIGSSVPWIGQIGSNDVSVQKAIDGADLYLTINPTIQQKLESIMKKHYKRLKADSIAVTIMDPDTGQIKAMGNHPDFNPNSYKKVYNQIKPLEYENRKIVQKDHYLDIPVLIMTGGELRKATYEERNNPDIKKYIFENRLGPQVFVDKNISFPYEPGSIFKAFTLAIGLDIGEFDLYDYYHDKGYVDVGRYKIKNVHEQECKGEHKTFLNALKWSCNVGMVEIAQKVKRYVFYNYLKKLDFGKKTGIELAGEAKGKISALEKFSKARFFNNSFGQGLLTTPIQIAVGYSSLVNGGYIYKPTVVDKICYNKKDQADCSMVDNNKTVKQRVFSQETSDKMKTALFEVMNNGNIQSMQLSGYTLGGKTGTSEIAFKGKYKKGPGWINGSFVGIVTKNDLKYVVVVQARRPRTCQWGTCSAGKIFQDISKFLINYEGIDK